MSRFNCKVKNIRVSVSVEKTIYDLCLSGIDLLHIECHGFSTIMKRLDKEYFEKIDIHITKQV
jgi:hypothetical protein